MEIQIPIEVLDEGCSNCPHMDISMTEGTNFYAGEKLIARRAKFSCTYLRHCKRLKERFEEKHE